MANPSIFLGQQYTDRDLIESVLSSFYIVDYGYVQKVNDDKTVDVVHAKKIKTIQGKTLPQTETKKIEVLTVAGSAFSLNIDIQPGDKVLLLGLKNYVQNSADVNEATETTVYMHYARTTMKALPLCAFNADAKVTAEIKDGEFKLNCVKFHVENGDCTVTMDGGNIGVACTSFKVTDSNGTAALEVTP